MADFELAEEADQDLFSIARYTDRNWGRKQAEKYRKQLIQHFAALVARDVLEKAAFKHRDDFRISRCEHHYVFFVRDENENVLILAILHKNMDLIARFRERLGGMGSRLIERFREFHLEDGEIEELRGHPPKQADFDDG